MEILVTAEEMRALDRGTIEGLGIPSVVLMERAALALVEEIKKRKPGKCRAVIFAGTGNNGGDGLAAARMLTQLGDTVRVVVTGNRNHATEEWKTQLAILEQMKIPVTPVLPDAHSLREENPDILIDAMLGTGLSRPLNDRISTLCDAINSTPAFTAAMDVPSGIHSDTGQVLGNAVRADLTVTLQKKKIGLVLHPGADYAGEIVTRGIGIFTDEIDAAPKTFTMDESDLSALPHRPAWANKGTFGHVLVIAGSRGMAGAACLCAEAAYRSGAGLVRVYTPECNREILQTRLPEAVLTTYPGDEPPEELPEDMAEWATSVVIGPGLGTSKPAAALLRSVLSYKDLPAVIDADALNLLAASAKTREYLHDRCILTPHLGEMSRLTGRPVPQIQSDPVTSAADFAQAEEITLVQKDARTIVVPPDGRFCFVNTCGNSGMSTGGSGDVLAGVIGGLLAQGLTTDQAAMYGVLMHACAGDRAAEQLGARAVLAGDILRQLR